MRAILILFAACLLSSLTTIDSALAQTISVVQGNGQLICDGCTGTGTYNSFDDIVVYVSDANGNPLANAPVTWTATDADQLGPLSGKLDSQATATGSNTSPAASLCNRIGYTCNRYSGQDVAGRDLRLATTRVVSINASLLDGQSVFFTLTEVPNGLVPGFATYAVNPIVLDPPANTIFLGPAGSTSSTPIHVSVATNGSQYIPNVSVRLVPEDGTPAGSPTATCATQDGADPGSVLTDRTGTATCNLVFGPTPTPGQPPVPVSVRILVGGVVAPQYAPNIQAGAGGPVGFAEPLFGRFQLVVTPAIPNGVQIVSGNNQTTFPGQAFPNPLVVRVTDASTPPNSVAKVPITWTVSPSNAATVVAANSISDSDGKVSAIVSLTSSARGLVQVFAATPNGKQGVFNLGIGVPVTGFAIAGGNGQTVVTGQAFQPISVQATTSSGQSPAGFTVQFTITGPGLLSAASATTDANGMATVGVTAGASAGAITIVATLGGSSVTFGLTVLTPLVAVTPENFLNGAGFFPTGDKNSGALSPCSIGTLVIGPSLDTTTLPAAPNLFSTPLQVTYGTNIAFNGESAPILNFGGSAQLLITFQVPCDVPPGPVPVSVTLPGLGGDPLHNTASFTLDIRGASPGIFEVPMSDGVRRAVAYRPDGTFISLENPAHRGEVVRVFLTGMGPTTPVLTTGALPKPGPDSLSIAAAISVALGDSSTTIPVLSTPRAAPSLIGVYELSFQLPADAPTGNDVFLEVGVLLTGTADYQFAQPGVGSKLPIQ